MLKDENKYQVWTKEGQKTQLLAISENKYSAELLKEALTQYYRNGHINKEVIISIDYPLIKD